MTSIVWAAAGMGLLGSLHCTVMCGPLAVAGCRGRSNAVGYVIGRLVTYVLAGAVFGAVGRAVPHDITHVALVLAAGLVFAHGLGFFARGREDGLVRLPKKKHPALRFIGSLLPRRGLGLGLVTGLLPCGLLFGAWALAASAASPFGGAAVMAVFSLVTLPALLAPAAVGPWVAKLVVRLPRPAIGILWCLLGVWLAARPWMTNVHSGCH